MKAKKTILIVGNMGAGKSTLCQLLEKSSGWKWLALDNFRGTASGSGWGKEHDAQKEFFHQFLNNEFTIVESTTLGKTYNIIKSLIVKHRIQAITIKLECSPEICHNRLMERNNLPLFPKRYNLWESLWLTKENLEKVQADATINVEEASPEEIANTILNSLT